MKTPKSVGEGQAGRAKNRAAKAASVSADLRQVVLAQKGQPPDLPRKSHPVSGLPYNAGRDRVVSDEKIRKSLEDFP